MSRPPTKAKVPTVAVRKSEPIERFRRIDELNLGRLGLICVQERIPAEYDRWEIDFEIDGEPAQLSCLAHPEHGGVPHGMDGDVLNALLAVFVEQGAPASGDIVTTAYQILQHANLSVGGRYYRNLHASIHRLNTAKYRATNAWRNHGQRRWSTQTFSLVERLHYDGETQTVGKGTVLHIRLPHQLVQSVHARYIKPLDTVLLEGLTGPLPRSLYRLLDAKRYDPADPRVITMELRMSLVAWGRECKLKDLAPRRIRRTLDPAHTVLLEHGYLQSVEYVGKADGQEVVYTFGDGPQFGVDLVSRLTAHGVGLHVAQKLVQDLPRDDLLHRLAKAEFLLARDGPRIQNKPGYVVSVLKDDGERFPDPSGFVPPVVRPPVPSAPVVSPPAARGAVGSSQGKINEEDLAVREAEEALRQHEQQLRAQPYDEQVEYAVSRLSLFLGRQLIKVNPKALTIIRDALTARALDPVEVERKMMQAMYANKADVYVRELLRAATSIANGAQGLLTMGTDSSVQSPD